MALDYTFLANCFRRAPLKRFRLPIYFLGPILYVVMLVRMMNYIYVLQCAFACNLLWGSMNVSRHRYGSSCKCAEKPRRRSWLRTSHSRLTGCQRTCLQRLGALICDYLCLARNHFCWQSPSGLHKFTAPFGNSSWARPLSQVLLDPFLSLAGSLSGLWGWKSKFDPAVGPVKPRIAAVCQDSSGISRILWTSWSVGFTVGCAYKQALSFAIDWTGSRMEVDEQNVGWPLFQLQFFFLLMNGMDFEFLSLIRFSI